MPALTRRATCSYLYVPCARSLREDGGETCLLMSSPRSWRATGRHQHLIAADAAPSYLGAAAHRGVVASIAAKRRYSFPSRCVGSTHPVPTMWPGHVSPTPGALTACVHGRAPHTCAKAHYRALFQAAGFSPYPDTRGACGARTHQSPVFEPLRHSPACGARARIYHTRHAGTTCAGYALRL